MNLDLFEIIVPSLSFFVAFFLIYLILEMVVVVILNRLVFSHWGLMTETPNNPKLKRSYEAEVGISLFISVSIVFLVLKSRIVDLLLISHIGIRLFALQAFLGMVLIYLITTRQLIKNDFIKKIHKYLYFYLSAIVFVAVVIQVNQAYGRLQDYLQVNVIHPYVTHRSLTLENKLTDDLLTAFRHKVSNHACPWVDLSTPDQLSKVQNMAYLTTHADLDIASKPINRKNPRDFLTGWLCTDPRATFLLTEHGEWYWMHEGNN
jgi:hypothetical protein